MTSDEKKIYNQAIDDVLIHIINGEVKGVKLEFPPEAIIHVFNKLKI